MFLQHRSDFLVACPQGSQNSIHIREVKKKSREGLFQKSLEHSHLDSHFPSILKKSTGKTEHHSFRNLSIHPDTCGIQQRHSYQVLASPDRMAVTVLGA